MLEVKQLFALRVQVFNPFANWLYVKSMCIKPFSLSHTLNLRWPPSCALIMNPSYFPHHACPPDKCVSRFNHHACKMFSNTIRSFDRILCSPLDKKHLRCSFASRLDCFRLYYVPHFHSSRTRTTIRCSLIPILLLQAPSMDCIYAECINNRGN